MFKFANAISLISAGVKPGSLLSDSAASGMPDVKNRSAFQLVNGEFWWNLLVAIGNAIFTLIYTIVRWILNIVDFLQYFCKHLVGIDYWEKGNVKLETLGESDIIFKFLYDKTVQRVFKYMLGLFVVLLIIFAIIAIIKNQYAVAAEVDKADNNPMGVLKKCFKAIFLVILVPVMLVMGILASNAVLAGLVNALNVNNRLTLGGQVFASSAYDANRYRKYAENNIRYAVTNSVTVTIGTSKKKISTSVEPVVPKDYNESNKFTGYAFSYKGNWYLYYVSMDELTEEINGVQGYRFYEEYFTKIMGAALADYTTFQTEKVSPSNNIIKAALSTYKKDSALNTAAYNTWEFNSIYYRHKASFENTLDATVVGFTADSRHNYASAKKYTNNQVWGAMHDGGKNGLVALQDEFLVMADVIDFAISDVAEIAYVNASSKNIDWTYGNATEGGYVDSRYISSNIGSGSGSISYINSFVVNYKNSGFVVYDVDNTSSKTAESDGVIYIVAYYSAANNKFIPLVNGKTFTDDYGHDHTFTSENLDSNYNGLIVARGILESTFDNQYGYPTEIDIDWNKDIEEGSTSTTTSKFFDATAKKVTATAVNPSSMLSNRGYNSSYTMVEGGLVKTKKQSVVSIENYADLSSNYSAIAKSLPNSFSYSDENNATRYISGVTWEAYPSYEQKIGSERAVVFRSNATLKKTVENADFRDGSADETTKLYDLPLFAFVTYTSKNTVNIYYVVAEYYRASGNFFEVKTNNTTGMRSQFTYADNKLMATYGIGSLVSSGEQVVGTIVNLVSTENTLSINASSFTYNDNVTSIDSTDANVLTDYTYSRSSYSYSTAKVLELHKEYEHAIFGFNESQEIRGTRQTVGSDVLYYYDYSGNVYRVRFNTEDYSVSCLTNQYYSFKIDGNTLRTSGAGAGTGSIYTARPYDMNLVETKEVGGQQIHTYTIYVEGINYQFSFVYKVENGVETYTPYTTNVYRVSLSYYNMFAFKLNGNKKQYNPVNQRYTDTMNVLASKTSYVSEDSIFCKFVSENDGKYIWQITVNNDDSEKSLFATFYTYGEVNSVDKESGITDSYRSVYRRYDLAQIPNYTGSDANAVVDKHLSATATIQFKREYVDANKFYIDFQINIKFLTGSNDTTRLKICFWEGFSATQQRTSAFQIRGAALRLDYNFFNRNAPSLELKIYYIPLKINFLILVFAACLMLSILGKAVWGLIQRIFDITLYFIILPGIASMMPLDDGSQFKNWKNNLIKKVFGAYGVMLGLNIFFILCPAIRNISHLFTADDMATLSEGNILAGMTPGFINSICEVLFTLVALTMIQTLPATIAQFIGSGAEDVVKTGSDVKQKVKDMSKDVQKTVSGEKALDFALGEKKDGKRSGGFFNGDLKNFIPGSAVYDEIKSHMKPKKEQKSSEQIAKEEAEARARRDADRKMQEAEEATNVANQNAPAEQKQETPQTPENGETIQTNIADQSGEANANNEAVSDEQAKDFEEGIKDGVHEEIENAVGDALDKEKGQEADENAEAPQEKAEEPASEKQEGEQGEESEGDEKKPEIDVNINNKGSVDYAKRAGELVGGEDKKDTTVEKDQGADQNAEAQNEQKAPESEGQTGATGATGETGAAGADAKAQESGEADKTGETQRPVDASGNELPTSEEMRNASGEQEIGMWQQELQEVENEIQSYKDELKGLREAKSDLFKNEGSYYGYNEKTGKFVPRDERELKDVHGEEARRLSQEIRDYNKMYEDTTEEERGLEKTIQERTAYRNEVSELVDGLKADVAAQATQEAQATAETTVEEKTEEVVEQKVEEKVEEKTEEAQGEGEGEQDKGDVEHAQTADVAKDVENPSDGGASISAERAKLYAEAAKLSSEASRNYADIAGGRIDKSYGLATSGKERGIDKDRQKLDKLLEQREERIREQAEGNADMKLGILQRQKAYEQFNKGKDVSETIFESNKKVVKEEAIKLWNSKQGRTKLTGKASDDQKLVEKAISEWKDVQALNIYNKKKGTDVAEVKDLSRRQLSEARKMLATDQYVKQATARVEFKDDVLDKKIAKQQTKIAMKEAGIYEAPLKKALLAMPRAAFSHKMTDKEEDRYRAKMDKWERKGKEASEKLKDMEKTYQEELKDFTEKNKLVIKNGKVDREATAKNYMSKLDVNDAEAVKKEMEYRAQALDKMETQYSKLANKEQYKAERKAELESQLSQAQRRFDAYSAQVQNERGGLAHVFARELKNGARVTKSKWQDARKLATKDAEAKQIAKEIDRSVKENRQKMNIDWSALKDQGLDVNHEDHTYSDKQRKTLQSKLASITAAEAKLRAERIALDKNGGKLNSDGEFDRLATAKELMKRSDPSKYTGAIPEPDAVKFMSEHIDEINKMQTGYLAAKDGIAKAKNSFASTVHKYDIANEQNFLASGRRLQNATLARVNAEKKRLVSELNDAARSGRLESDQEAAYIEKINGINQTIDRIKSDPVRFKRAKDKDIKVVQEKFKESKAPKEPKPVKVKPAKGAAAAREFLASDEKIAERKAKVEYNDAQTAQKVAEKVGREEARKTALDETSQRDYINKVRKALAQSGYAGDITKIRTTDDAKKIRSEIESQLEKASQAKAEEIARKLRTGGKQSELDELKTQEKLINQRLKKIRSVDTQKQMNNSVNIREDIKAASERAAGTAIRNQYKDEWNKFMKSQGMRDIAKSGSSAFDKNMKMQKKLQEENANLEKRIKALEAGGVKIDDTRVKTLQTKLDQQAKQIESLKAMNRKTEEQARKAMKNFTSINRVMQDMRRQSKYKIKGLEGKNNPTNPTNRSGN